LESTNKKNERREEEKMTKEILDRLDQIEQVQTNTLETLNQCFTEINQRFFEIEDCILDDQTTETPEEETTEESETKTTQETPEYLDCNLHQIFSHYLPEKIRVKLN